MHKKQPQDSQNIRFFRWDGDACRVYLGENGEILADLYRAGKGNVPISETDLWWNGVEISEAMYKELVLEEIRIAQKKATRRQLPPSSSEEVRP